MVGEPTTEQAKRIHKARYSSVPMVKLRGARYTLKRGAHGYPDSLMNVPDPPENVVCAWKLGCPMRRFGGGRGPQSYAIRDVGR